VAAVKQLFEKETMAESQVSSQSSIPHNQGAHGGTILPARYTTAIIK